MREKEGGCDCASLPVKVGMIRKGAVHCVEVVVVKVRRRDYRVCLWLGLQVVGLTPKRRTVQGGRGEGGRGETKDGRSVEWSVEWRVVWSGRECGDFDWVDAPL